MVQYSWTLSSTFLILLKISMFFLCKHTHFSYILYFKDRQLKNIPASILRLIGWKIEERQLNGNGNQSIKLLFCIPKMNFVIFNNLYYMAFNCLKSKVFDFGIRQFIEDNHIFSEAKSYAVSIDRFYFEKIFINFEL